jgi:hypothetical protein
MTVLEVLAEVVGAEEFLSLVAFSKLVHMVEVFRALFPARRIGEFVATIAADVCTITGHGRVEGGFWACKRSTRPRVTSQVQRVLVTFCFVLVLEAVRTISTAILLFGLVQPGD